MKKTSSRLVTAISLALAAQFLGWAPASASDAPDVGDVYQERIDRAWQEAVEGANPSGTCAGVKGRAMNATDSQALRALFACNVDIPVRYFDTYLDQVEAGEATCQSYMIKVVTKLPALTMSTDSLQQMADSVSASGDSEAAVSSALGPAAEEAMTENGLEDPKRLVKNRLDVRTRELCPQFADVILN